MVGEGSEHRSPARDAAAAFAILLLLIAVAFGGVSFRGRTLSAAAYVPGVLPSGPVLAIDPPLPPPVRDVEGAAWVDEPSPLLVHRALAARRLPLWNAAEGLGAPLAGNPNSGSWAPLQLPVNLWPTPLVQDLAWLTRVLVLGVTTWLLAREIGCSAVGAIASAAALMLSGQTVLWIDHHPLNTDAFVPLALAAGLRIARGRAGIGLFALATGLALLGVKPQSALVATGFGLLWLCAAALDLRRSPARAGLPRALFGWGAGAALGAACAAVALVPFAESFGLASSLVRSGRSSQAEWSLPLSGWPALAGPAALELWQRVRGGVEPTALPAHAGALVLACASLGWARARRTWLGWALGATVAFYLLKIFGALPFAWGGVPLIGAVNFVKYCFPLYLALALLAGLGLTVAAREGSRSSWPGLAAAVAAALLAAELCWLVPRERPMRVDPYRPAPYVDALRALVAATPGRLSGPVDLMPPLVSAALGLRDLRAIDVLTPSATYDFVTRFVAPSQGLTWVLADPAPLLAATAPAAALADLRYVLSRAPLDAAELPAAVRSMASSRRLNRLFSILESYRTETSRLGGGLDDRGGDRRFHWTCETPCRLRFRVRGLRDPFAVGLASGRRASIDARVRFTADGGETREVAAALELDPEQAEWQDLWLDGPSAAPEPRAAAAPSGVVAIEIDSPTPAEVYVGGVGPSPGRLAEREAAERELAARQAVFARLRERYADETARIYENPSALGEAFFAPSLERAAGRAELEACLERARESAAICVDAAEVPDGVATAAPGEVRVLSSVDDALTIQTRSAAARLLVVSRLRAPGWKALRDGKPTPLLGVDSTLMGVVVPPGAHRIALRYAPRSLRVGAAISLVGVLLLLFVVRYEARRRAAKP